MFADPVSRKRLHLVDRHRPPQIGDKARRILDRATPPGLVIEGDDLPLLWLALGDLRHERALAHLPGAQHDDNPRIRKRGLHIRPQVPRNERRHSRGRRTRSWHIRNNSPADPQSLGRRSAIPREDSVPTHRTRFVGT
jgi:hypothetical protein